jgi:hypothetical protein
MTADYMQKLNRMHTEPVEFCAKNRTCAFTSLCKSLQDPLKPVWGDRKYAPIIVAMEKVGAAGEHFDWRFHLGFGQRFFIGVGGKNYYYCMGFAYGGLSRGKFVIAYEMREEQYRDKKRKHSSGVTVESGIRLYSTNQVVQCHIPRVDGDILSASETAQEAFFAAVQHLFSFNSVLPDVTILDKEQVSRYFLTILLLYFRLTK